MGKLSPENRLLVERVATEIAAEYWLAGYTFEIGPLQLNRLLNAARSEAQPSGTEPRPYPFASPGLKYSEAFVFEGGSLTVNTTGYGAANGAGWLCFLEKELEWERGDNGQDYRIANLDRSELIALRDKLNEVFPALTFTASLSDASPKPAEGDA